MKKSVIKIYFGVFFEIQKRFLLKFLHMKTPFFFMKFQMALYLYIQETYPAFATGPSYVISGVSVRSSTNYRGVHRVFFMDEFKEKKERYRVFIK